MVTRGWQHNPMWLAVFEAVGDYTGDQHEAEEATHAVFANLKAHGYKVVTKGVPQKARKPKTLSISQKDTEPR